MKFILYKVCSYYAYTKTTYFIAMSLTIILWYWKCSRTVDLLLLDITNLKQLVTFNPVLLFLSSFSSSSLYCLFVQFSLYLFSRVLGVYNNLIVVFWSTGIFCFLSFVYTYCGCWDWIIFNSFYLVFINGMKFVWIFVFFLILWELN